jgi:gliding motility-associated-like protein
LRFSSDPDKVAQYTAIDKLTQTGTYYYVAQDLNTGCTDTASAYIGIRQRPRVAMSSVDTVEACEYQALAVNGMAGDYKEILNVCVEDMGSEIIEEGWIIGGAKYNGEPISHVHDGSRMLYYAVNECGMTSSDSSLAWSCEYVYNRENGTFESKLTTEQMLKDTVSNGAPMKVHQKINPDSMLLTARFEGRPRVWVGENVNLDMKSIYKDKGIEYHWYKVVGDMDASSQMFDGYGNVLEDYINPLDEADELLTVSSIFDSDFGTYFYENLLDTTLFYVVVTDNVCTSAASNVVKVDAYDFIPTAITPHNSKDMNDVFMPGFQVEIFNRYGNKVFEGNDGWDGKIRGVLADPTVYYYVITMKDGSVRKGSVEVVYFK